MKKRAVTYQLKDLSGKDHERHEREMVALGQMWGYDIARRLLIPAFCDTPLLKLVQAIQKVEAEAVFVPYLAHLGGSMRAVTEQCILVDTLTFKTYARHYDWQKTLSANGF
ncbi:hypothetical protein [Nocardia sp. XZ_19_385]|uniref:hypothetical protein n=1 Tax=Nocardia sp. XZ_19_385 TaxID=2769488 RepID=UPI00188F40A4|nr:hypothetical protein [Nocardia sp. XZ_19_385]